MMKLNHKVQKSPAFIFDYLTNVQKFVSVHPVIYKMEKLGDKGYLVYETLKLGFIPVSFTYMAVIKSDIEGKRVVMNATVMKINKIEMIFDIKPEMGHSIISEEINFKTVLPIKSLMGSIFKKQHAQLFRNIENMAQ